MRLIDADKLQIKHFVQRGDQPIGYEGTQPLYDYTDLIAYDVDNAPTVKAIPIEWINNWLNTGRNAKYFIPMMRMVEDWEKENDRD